DWDWHLEPRSPRASEIFLRRLPAILSISRYLIHNMGGRRYSRWELCRSSSCSSASFSVGFTFVTRFGGAKHTQWEEMKRQRDSAASAYLGSKCVSMPFVACALESPAC